MERLKMERLKNSKDNRIARLYFIDYWANFVRTHPDKEWGEQQNMLIDSMMQAAKHYPLTTKEYLKMRTRKSVLRR